MSVEGPGRGEACLQNIPPRTTPLAVIAQCAERHPKIAGGHDAHFLSKSPRRAPVVGNRHNRGEPLGEWPKSAETRKEAVTAAQGHDARPSHDIGLSL